MNQICKVITKNYLESNRFNGSPIQHLWDRNEIRKLIATGYLEIVGPGIFPNPHIKPFSNIPVEIQLEEFDSKGNECCVYPSKLILNETIKPIDYEGLPYTKRMALGGGQLDGVFFDLMVLEQYRNDPRYYYWADDINGQICIQDEHYRSEEFPEKDKVLLETFGFGYNEEGDRCVVSLLWYLSTLSKEHQQIWQARELSHDEFEMHPDYYRTNIIGDWGERLPICEAFIMELSIINKMAIQIKGISLFRNDYSNARPKEFAFLIRPTLLAFNSFILLLDQMMSDNINKNFFADEIEDEYDHEREDGKIEVRRKGTIAILDEWINRYFRPQDKEPLKDMIAAFRNVRKLRQKPAHYIQDDSFNQKYIKEQRQIIKEAYGAVRTLRQILANHPKVKINPPEIDNQLWTGKIWVI